MSIETKYADKVSMEHAAAMNAVGFVGEVLRAYRQHYETLDKIYCHMSNVGHILDPTLYRDMINSKNFDRQIRLIKATLTFLKEIDTIADEIDKEADRRP